ncbi:hypothetical protein DPMN_039572 [Dreissena polymorpha]|uniref:Uncharacterized protein n=1 Tax=Dreissena polymorpha TaxID=45954 RepID=A0A9D4HU54_DREPO|nr:hypothetical protein DPMN_039572 [Dreissena polymorpha]
MTVRKLVADAVARLANTRLHGCRWHGQKRPVPHATLLGSVTEPVLSQFDYVRTQFFFIRCAVVTRSKAVLTPSYYVLQRDDRKKILSRLKVRKHLSRSTPFQGVHKVRRQFVTRCYYDHSVLTQFEPV